jgi:hypothetical protein
MRMRALFKLEHNLIQNYVCFSMLKEIAHVDLHPTERKGGLFTRCRMSFRLVSWAVDGAGRIRALLQGEEK